MPKYWRVAPEWRGAPAFIVCGGTSVEAHLDSAGLLSCLKGRRTIAINTSFERVPFADFLFFGDHQWWDDNHRHLDGFKGRIATVSLKAGYRQKGTAERLLRLKRVIAPPAFAPEPDSAAMRHTSLTPAINMAVHLGAGAGASAPIVLVGADMGPGPDGRTHHHRPHPRKGRLSHYRKIVEELALAAETLHARGITVLNASPHADRLPFWPKVDLAEVLA